MTVSCQQTKLDHEQQLKAVDGEGQFMLNRCAGLIFLLLLSGCAGLEKQPDRIRVTVSDIQLVESTLFEQLYRVGLRIQNRGETPIAISGGSFDLAINGRELGSGVTDQAVTIPGYSDARVDVRMVSTAFGMMRLVLGMQERSGPSLEYEIAGRFSVDGALGGVSFSEKGEVSLPGG